MQTLYSLRIDSTWSYNRFIIDESSQPGRAHWVSKGLWVRGSQCRYSIEFITGFTQAKNRAQQRNQDRHSTIFFIWLSIVSAHTQYRLQRRAQNTHLAKTYYRGQQKFRTGVRKCSAEAQHSSQG